MAGKGSTTGNKLIRDRIPEIIRKDGAIPETRTLTPTEFVGVLKTELLEESQEAAAVDSARELTTELADVIEVVNALAALSYAGLYLRRKGRMEPEQLDTPTSGIDRWMDRAVDLVERILIAGVVVVLVVLSFMALWDSVVLIRDQVQAHDLTRAITVGVDTVFLTVILLELLHTVVGREPLARQAPDFIVIGITSAIRHGLSVVATASSSGETVNRVIAGKTYRLTVPGSGNPREIVIDLAINSVGVLILVVGLWVVRHSFKGLAATEEV